MSRLDLSELNSSQVYENLTKLVSPRPLFWAVTKSRTDENWNIAPFSFVTISSITEPHVLIAVGKGVNGEKSKTLKNIEKYCHFTLNTTDEMCFKMLMNACKGNDYSSVPVLGNGQIKGAKSVSFCEYVKTIDEEFLDNYLVIARVSKVSVAGGGSVGCANSGNFFSATDLIKMD